MNSVINLTATQVEQINQSIRELGGKIQTALNKLGKIESYLYDDDETSSKGMVQVQREHEKRLDKLEGESMQRKKIWATFGLVAGIIGTALVEFIKWLFTNHQTLK
ncbi:MAG: hypothetical protein V4547_16845 [Bacteroidota bacterium]